MARPMRSALSKSIQKHIRRDLRKHKQTLINEKISSFENLKSIAAIRNNRKRQNLARVLDMKGQLQDSHQGIVDAFA
eukprot:6243732-Karenia_brevis.AAC.1